MYESTPGIKSKFQGVALHPYTGSYKNLTARIEEVRRVLKANHDAGKGLWITEIGWSSEPPSRQATPSPRASAGQATQLKGAFRLLSSNQRKWNLQRIYWFSVDDQPASATSAAAPASSARLQAEARLVRLRPVRRRHPVGFRLAARPTAPGRKIGGLATRRESECEI